MTDPEARLKRVFAANFIAAWADFMKRSGKPRMSRQALADLVSAEAGRESLDHTSIRDWEQGESLPGHVLGLALARVLGTTYGQLLGEAPPLPYEAHPKPGKHGKRASG